MSKKSDLNADLNRKGEGGVYRLLQLNGEPFRFYEMKTKHNVYQETGAVYVSETAYPDGVVMRDVRLVGYTTDPYFVLHYEQMWATAVASNPEPAEDDNEEFGL